MTAIIKDAYIYNGIFNMEILPLYPINIQLSEKCLWLLWSMFFDTYIVIAWLGPSVTFLSNRWGITLLTILPSFKRQRQLFQSFMRTHCLCLADENQFGSNTKAFSTHLEHKMSSNCFKATDCWVNVLTPFYILRIRHPEFRLKPIDTITVD